MSVAARTAGEDAAGELYAVHYGGELYRIVPR